MTTSDALPSPSAEVIQAATEFQWDGHSFEAGIGLAASGGGFRAMLFHAGAFNQVRALRRRDLIDRLIAGNRLADESKLVSDKARGRMGAYWGIDTIPLKSRRPARCPASPLLYISLPKSEPD